MDSVKQKQPGLTPNSILIERKIVRYRIPNDKKSPLNKKDLINATMPDQYINQKARNTAIENFNNSNSRKVEKAAILVGLPAAASVAEGALKPAKTVAEKSMNTLKAAKGWGVAIAGMLGAYKLMGAAVKKNSGLNEFAKEKPGVVAVGALTGSIGAAMAANPVVNAVSSRVGKIKTDGQTIGSKVKAQTANFADKLNKSSVGKKLDAKLFEPVKKALTGTKVGKFAVAWATPLLVGGVAAKLVHDSAKIKRDTNKIKQDLEEQKTLSQLKIVDNNPFKVQ